MHRLKLTLAAAVLAVAAGPQAMAQDNVVRAAVQQTGTVMWELDTIKRNGLDTANGFTLEISGLASGDATRVALLAGEADVMVTDWPSVSELRALGEDVTFIPYSLTVGALMVAPDSPIDDVGDLEGKRLGVAGGEQDKSWLLIRALALKDYDLDLTREAEAVFGAPPLLSEELRAGRIDAVLTYWHFAARLNADGFKRVISLGDVLQRLGLEAPAPMLGYVFRESWANENPDLVQGFSAASAQAKQLLATSDEEWERLRELTRAENDAVLAALRDGYREGIPQSWGEDERAAAEQLFAIFSQVGGEQLVGPAPALQPGTFWAGVMF